MGLRQGCVECGELAERSHRLTFADGYGLDGGCWIQEVAVGVLDIRWDVR